MKITINVMKRHLYFLILLVTIFLAVTFVAARYANPTTNVGHDVDEIDWSKAIISDVNINGNVKATGICLAGDCKTSWSQIASAETDPTVKAWAKTDDPTIPGTIRGATYGFGGIYTTQASNAWGSGGIACAIQNPFTGDCSCPAGYGAILIGNNQLQNSFTLCYK